MDHLLPWSGPALRAAVPDAEPRASCRAARDRAAILCTTCGVRFPCSALPWVWGANARAPERPIGSGKPVDKRRPRESAPVSLPAGPLPLGRMGTMDPADEP